MLTEEQKQSLKSAVGKERRLSSACNKALARTGFEIAKRGQWKAAQKEVARLISEMGPEAKSYVLSL